MNKIKYIDRKTNKIKTENPPGENYLKFLYNNPFGKIPLNLIIKRKITSKIYGRLMDKPKSKNKIKQFVKTYNINMTESLKPIKEFKTFNEFFYRKLKPESRHIQSGIISPADGKLIAFENIQNIKSFFIKGNKFTLEKFLQNKILANNYKTASLIIIRLAPNDYHRFHFPYKGKISKTTKINGKYYSVSPYAIKNNFTIFCENKREYSILKTKTKGNILISEIGATMVGKIIQTYKANQIVEKGQEKGYFAFGGSSLLILIDNNKININKDILENTKKGFETSIQMGESIEE